MRLQKDKLFRQMYTNVQMSVPQSSWQMGLLLPLQPRDPFALTARA
jgi:hypothetical protein